MRKPLKQHRRDILKKEGFLPFEAMALSQNRMNTPGMKELRKERRQLLRQDKKRFLAETKKKPLRKGQDPATAFNRRWERLIRNYYDVQRWYDTQGRLNPYARLRELTAMRDAISPNWRELYTSMGVRPKKSPPSPAEYRKRAEATRKYTVTVTYEIDASDEQSAREQVQRQVRGIQRVQISEVD